MSNSFSFFEKIAEIKSLLKTRDINVISDKKGGIRLKIKGKKDINLTLNINKLTVVVPYSQTLRDIEKEKYIKDKFYYSKEKTIQSIAINQVSAGDHTAIVDRFKPYLIRANPKDVAALRHAASICHLEDEGVNEKELNPYRHTLDYFFDSKRGFTLYNWLRCGEVFPKEIFPYMDICLIITETKEDFERLFLPFWENRLAFHPTKIFVARAENMSSIELLHEIKVRLIDNKVDHVKIYTRRTRNEFARDVIKKDFLINERYKKIFELKEEKYKIGDSPSRTFILKRR